MRIGSRLNVRRVAVVGTIVVVAVAEVDAVDQTLLEPDACGSLVSRGNGVYRKTRLRNGLRVVTERLPGVRSISLGVWVDVGSRSENDGEAGLSHFVEHLVFKGTRGRNARQIAGSLESIGGALNAFTTREQTCFTARVLDEHLPQAVDVLADLTCRPTLTSVNMNRERTVICEEIRESLDNPADHIHDLFADTFWGGHPLGRPIMGSEQSITEMPRARLVNYRRRNYRTESVVIAACGSVSHERLLKLVRQKFDLPEGSADLLLPAERPRGPRVNLVPNGSGQTQFCVGFPGVAYSDRSRMATSLLASYLGGGMSSVLFQKIREERGLAYSVYAYHDFYRDAGMFAVYLGTDQVHLRNAFDLIMTEARRATKRTISPATLNRVKAQVKGHLTLALEATTSRMHRLGRQELLTENLLTLGEALNEIDRVKPADIREAAQRVFDEANMTVTALGPVDEKLFRDIG